ncbi:MAG: leucine--tRNA ligase [Candidatus Pacebacteria bacterium]|nr:leucine--tRNA ligase [Candidatus Paceibacterota bacterium]MDD3728711.1 leucine--tRNA ligase [Candidatus Paceibacterota bacterium]MDD4201431.1 leucine--tRNA ligase [Candidatus Paceibacterota bacterium]MDD4897219.1 leucine--tRNA ligase [Candidatus Paceibacterota bacterium]MDD5445725.1 leucine--tRNA ligase [Candidatus Paceibacterota bacterium]
MKKYEPKKIEQKWQNVWEKKGVFKAKDFSKKKKLYLLVEFPYPSGEGLHVGHCRSFTAFDIIARKKRMEGYNVLYPIGWDAFGLPTENHAIKKGLHPSVITKKNTDTFRRQLKKAGFSFDFSREINTTNPDYYKWTQWIFIQMFKKGLAYKDKMDINWCPSCKIGLANEEVISGNCERCNTKVEKKEKEQWMLRITKYADRLIKDLDLVDYLEKIKIQQKEWIGKSEGALVKFYIEEIKEYVEVFTTRIDTIFSGTFLILSPGHKIIEKHKDKIKNIKEVMEYHRKAKNTSDIDRTNIEKEITGVKLEGLTAINPATNEKMQVWSADFVLEHYGSGAVFADAHDIRDFKMAKIYNLPLKISLIPKDKDLARKVENFEECFEGEGTLCNSMQFDGISSSLARPLIISFLKKKGLAKEKTVYKLRDWVFSRQHYWGEPIPMVFCKKCGWTEIPEKELPLKLPDVKKYQPSNTGESPLSLIPSFVNTKCPKCKGEAKRETDTMPNWAGSNWYFLRYLDVKNNKKLADSKKIKYWMPVDWYNGGMEHVTLHLLYSRFVYKFLWDINAVPKEIGKEPYKKRTAQGMILGQGGIKMSKSKGNVVNPEEIIDKWGSDVFRVYIMFMGPFEQAISWDSKGIKGARRFLEKVFAISVSEEVSSGIKKNLQKTIRKVSKDIDALKFNTAISSLMEFSNSLKDGKIDKENFKDFLKILSPFAPHLCEHLWNENKFKDLCLSSFWPKFSKELEKEKELEIVVQVNGKLRAKLLLPIDISEEEAKKVALSNEKVKSNIGEKKIKRVVFVPKKLINFVI